MANPFDDKESKFVAVINEEGQYSLWPAWMDVPQGWDVAREEGSRSECLEFIERSWTDMRPLSLVKASAR